MADSEIDSNTDNKLGRPSAQNSQRQVREQGGWAGRCSCSDRDVRILTASQVGLQHGSAHGMASHGTMAEGKAA